MKVGYIRVSKHEQHKHLQEDAMAKAGCERVFVDDGVTGTRFDRKGLQEALDFLRAGDVLVVWKFDRAGRSLTHLIEMVNTMKERDIGFISLTEQVDTTTPGGRFFFHMIGAIAEFEHDLIVERTRAGLDAARARGRKGGPKHKLSPADEEMLVSLYDTGKYTAKEVGERFKGGISEATVHRIVVRHRQQQAG